MIPFMILSIGAVICDIRHRVIPDLITLPGILFGIYYNTGNGGLIGFKGSIEGMLAGFAVILFAGLICYLISNADALGGGDLKLMAMIGSFWGVEVVLLTFAISPFLGSIYAATMNKTKLPYGVFIITAWGMAYFIKDLL